jgi:hypothetical protein
MTGSASWEGRLAEMDGAPRKRRPSCQPPKGPPPPRACPEDFEVIFVEIGRLACETWFHASRTTITRWLKEKGMNRLIRRRADFVAHKRAQGEWITRQTRMVNERPRPRREAPVMAKARDRIPPALARQAAHFLRIRRHGGWIVSPAGDGMWWLGARKCSAAQMVEIAEARGFDRCAANLQIRAESKVRG